MQTIIKSFIACLLLLFLSTSQADEVSDLEILIQKNEYSQAYQLAQKLLFTHEGEVKFDFLYGFAALETRHAAEAIFAFERVLASQPENQRARLELARAYYAVADFQKSKELFNIVLEQQPPESVQTNIKQFLQQIEKYERGNESQTYAYAELTVGWDSNINQATDKDTLNIGNLVFTLTPGSQEIDAVYANVKLGGNYLNRINKVDSWFVGGEITSKQNMSENLDTVDGTISTGYLRINGDTRIRIPVSYQQATLDGEDYRDLSVIGFEYTRFTTSKEYSAYFAQYGMFRYPQQSARDVDFLTLGYVRTFLNQARNSLATLALYAGFESAIDSGNKFNARDYLAVSFGSENSVQPQTGLFYNLSAQLFEYQAVHTVFNTTRSDQYASAVFGYGWQLNDEWLIKTEASYARNFSNIALYEYDRITASITARVTF